MSTRLCLIKSAGAHSKSGTTGRNKTGRSQRPRCVVAAPQAGRTFQRNLDHPKMDGVSTYLALIFGTLLSSQGTDASFVLTLRLLWGFPPGASLRSCVSDSIRSFRSDFLGAFQVPASAFPFPAFPTLSDPFGPDSQSEGLAFRAVGPFRRVRL